jgi:hypothetical protein
MGDKTSFHQEKCGACGHKCAYLIRSRNERRVVCRFCGASRIFPQDSYRLDYEGYTEWPGSLEAAAKLLIPKE